MRRSRRPGPRAASPALLPDHPRSVRRERDVDAGSLRDRLVLGGRDVMARNGSGLGSEDYPQQCKAGQREHSGAGCETDRQATCRPWRHRDRARETGRGADDKARRRDVRHTPGGILPGTPGSTRESRAARRPEAHSSRGRNEGRQVSGRIFSATSRFSFESRAIDLSHAARPENRDDLVCVKACSGTHGHRHHSMS